MRKQRKGKKYPIAKGLGGVPDQASLTENVGNLNQPGGSGTGGFYTTNTSYRLYDLSLGTCPRATLVGQAYQEFRIRRITLVYRTTADTFVSGAYAAPTLYYMIDKRGAVPLGADQNVLRQMGSTPHRFDDKNITVKWAPAVLQASLSDPGSLTTAASAAEISPWLPTNNSPVNPGAYVPSDIDHFGITWYVLVPPSYSTVTYDVDIYVDFEFRKPRWNGADVPPPSARVLNWNQAANTVPVESATAGA